MISKYLPKIKKRTADSDKNNKNMHPEYRNGIWH